MKIIKVNFIGGLGNQLFQYAFCRSLMKINDILIFDITNYKKDYLKRECSIINMNIKGKINHSNLLRKLLTPGTKINFFINVLGLFKFIKETSFFLQKNIKTKDKNFILIQGYWQSEFYFSSFRKELILELKPISIPTLPYFMQYLNTVAIHVRRKDYLNDSRYGFLGEEYYKKAIDRIKQHVSNPTFIFFSDDLEWCKKVFNQNSTYFCDLEDWSLDYLQLHLISRCSHQIIANSSFSWWGAWLNENESKIVIRPAKPFHDKTLFYENYYPNSWIKI